MASLGRIEEFDIHHPEEWTAYAERLDAFLSANDINKEEKKKAILLSVCGKETYKLLRSLVSPGLPTDKSYESLRAALKDHFAPQPSRIVRRNQFYRRDQQSGESISLFVAELRRLAEHCEFGANLEEMLCDHR